MALLKTSFYNQVSLATILKTAKKTLSFGEKLEFWEADVNFHINKSDFSFSIREPTKRELIYSDKGSYNDYIYSPLIAYESRPPKRFMTKKEAEYFILFSIIQVYKPLKNYIDDNEIVEEFERLLDTEPEKILKELENGKSWMVN